MKFLSKYIILLLVLNILPLGKTWFCYAQNPIINTQFTADPTAKVFKDSSGGERLYLFPSHDIINPVNPERRWFAMADYHVFSTDDMTNWTDHGVILSQEQVPWGSPKGYAMWAPDCVSHNGKYYLFFPDVSKEEDEASETGRGRSFGIGVAIADKPEGPYTPQPERIKGIIGIDPCVLQASNGENVIFWGSGAIYQAKLKQNLLELESEPQLLDYLPKAGLQEGPFAFERNGKYYLTYPWVRKNGGTEALVYCMSDNPTGPWEYKGVIMKEHANGCWTNHHSIVQFKRQWYLFYHHNDYSPKFDKNRSVCIDSLYFNDDGTIQEVIPTLRGVGITDAASRIQMDRYSHIGGDATIVYNDTTNYFLGWKTILPHGGWVSYGSVRMKRLCSGKNLASHAWVCFSNNKVVRIKKTKLALHINKQQNGLYELVLTNNGDATKEVDWISISKRKPKVFK